jgi:hypothetical protein
MRCCLGCFGGNVSGLIVGLLTCHCHSDLICQCLQEVFHVQEVSDFSSESYLQQTMNLGARSSYLFRYASHFNNLPGRSSAQKYESKRIVCGLHGHEWRASS